MSVEVTIETVEETIVLELQDLVPAVLTIDNIPELRDELDSKVDKEAGLGLSELSFTIEDKLSLDQSEQDRHTHNNKTVIDDLSDDSGVLQYKGLPISDQVALDAKVDKVAGYSLVDDAEIAKLVTVQENATANRADSENADKVHTHVISDVTGLTTRLNDIDALVSAVDAVLRQDLARPPRVPVYDATNIPLASYYDKQQIILDGDPPEMAFSYKDQWRTYGGDVLPFSESACAEIVRLRGGVVARSLKIASGAFLVSNKYLNDTGAEYRLVRNVDGLLQNKSARVGGVGLTPAGAGQPASDLMDITAPSGNAYTVTIGGSWSSSFIGDAFSFRSYADDRGGVWRMVVDEGTEKEKILMVSTWSETAIFDRYVGYAGFGPGVHTVKAIFVGADTEHPPTSQARGWFKGVTASTIYDASWGIQSGAPDILGGAVNEFAISAKATPSPHAADWVPSHGGRAGSVQNIRTSWIIDGVEVQEPTEDILTFQTIRIEQEYEAYSTRDTESLYKMWDGVLVIEFGEFGIRYENHIHTTQELSVGDGYVGMLAANLNFVDRVLFSTGVDMPVSAQESSENRTYIFPHAQSATYYDSDGSAYLAMTVRSLSEVLDESDEQSLFIVERSDGVSKVYWRKWGASVIPNGSKISSAVLTVAGGRV